MPRPPEHDRLPLLAGAAWRGAVSGAIGVAAMTLAEKVEQRITHRPDSFVPGRALRALVGRPAGDQEEPLVANHAIHWATGALLGALRGVWSAVGLRGPRASATHGVVRLAFDQTVENVAGAGAPPHTWPPLEQLVDAGHKFLYAGVTGLVSDLWVAPALESWRGTTSH